MSSTPQQPFQEPVVTQRYQPPQGAIPIEKLKRVAIGLGILILALLTTWGSCHKTPVANGTKKLAAWPTSSSEIDSQQAELSREMDEAKRAAQQAELAKQRAQHMTDDDSARALLKWIRLLSCELNSGSRICAGNIKPPMLLRLPLRLKRSLKPDPLPRLNLQPKQAPKLSLRSRSRLTTQRRPHSRLRYRLLICLQEHTAWTRAQSLRQFF
jgi:hypothetical protein